ncbi:hypothetical protein L484_009989 [Morus notabilis]|uniref:Uncharacterized protein n=1 Tax=Morus notabilis TaxID=981085 RepID=W9SFP0_9ROSA|nr:uncharacterized protein LOC21393301 isoform X2 [Morus notabilis]EXC26167.1 hypothetical protein L484_009989 [Morus notabilis]
MANLPSSSSPQSLSSASNSDNSPATTTKPTSHSSLFPKLQVDAGENNFDEKTPEVATNFQWPCMRSYADTVKAFEDQNSSESVTVNETPSNISNGKHLPKKNG